jgi:signal transduction histidine kinase
MTQTPKIRPRWQPVVAAMLALSALSLATICTINSTRWIGTTFPGFFVMANRVIASVSLPHWPAANADVFQHAVVAVNGRRVSTSREIYAAAAQMGPGSSINYSLEQDGDAHEFVARTLRFTARDYLLIFVPYLVSGVALALIGIVVWYSKPAAPASLALLLGGLSGGVFAITGADLYSPHWFFRLHILGEAFFPASLLVHLALVFPVDRIRRRRRLILALPYAVAGAMGIAYEVFLYRPAAYSLIHNLCMVYAGFGGAALLIAVAWDYWTTTSQLIRQRIRIILLGFLCGFAFPGALMFYSGVTGGQASVNYAGLTVVLFPLSIGYAIVKHDLFEIDAMVKRSVYYIAITATLGLAYLGFLSATDFALHSTEFSHSPLFPLSFTLAVVIFINPLKDAVQRAVDRVFFRLRYNPKEMLQVASAALASTLQLGDIVSFIWNTISGTMGILSGWVFVLSPDGIQYGPIYPDDGSEAPRLSANHPLADCIRRRHGRVLSRYDLEEESAYGEDGDRARQAFEVLHAQLIVPLILKGDLIGFLALGQKESGAFFSIDDIGFLTALANQGAVSIANAIAYREIQNLNSVLEQRVADRTAQLSKSNADLQASVRQVEQAYRDLQRSQEELGRAEKMATLGRLAAGIAHEMNTPLGASMTSLKLLQDLVDEYNASSTDPQVTPDDHREIAKEMNKLVGSTRDWLRKAAAHIRSLKLHTRALQNTEPAVFSVTDTIEDVRLLLSHRLRAAQSALVVHCSANNVTLYGDPGKLGQALTNLVSNAIDANADAGRAGAEIRIDVSEEGGGLVIRVRDCGRGIPPEHSSRIFEEFFSTKSMGEGTGLGLPIARDIVSNFFGGMLSVESSSEQGSVLTIHLPRDRKHSTAVALPS